MQVIVIKRSSGAAIYHEMRDIMGVLATLNGWMNQEARKQPGERESVTVRFTTISREFWEALPDSDE